MSFNELAVLDSEIPNVYGIDSIKSSLPKSMQPSIPPIGRRLSFSTSQVDLTHSDDYHYCIEVKTIVVMLIGASLSEPHIDHDNVPRRGECLYLSMYLSGCV